MATQQDSLLLCFSRSSLVKCMTVSEYEEVNDSIAVKYQSISMDGYSGCGKAWGCMYYAVLEKLYNTTISATNT